MRSLSGIFLFFPLLFQLLFAQQPSPSSGPWAKLTSMEFKPVLQLQLWGTYTHGQQRFDSEPQTYELVDNRMDVSLRRGRVGFKLTPYDRLTIAVVGAFDNVGHDGLSGTVSGYNPPNPNFGLWDAFVQWKAVRSSDAVHLTAGYFRPQINRESLTSAWTVNSFEKAWSQNYFRQHLVGTGPGRATGVNLGGFLPGEGLLSLTYDVGLFFPLTTSADPALRGISRGAQTAPLGVAKLTVHLGDPEHTAYKLGKKVNYFNQRKGISFSLAGAHQGETELFAQSQTLGVDLLANYGPLNLDGDWSWMYREGTAQAPTDGHYISQTGHLRLGYNLLVRERFFLELMGMVMHFHGGLTAQEQADAAAVRAFSGTETTYDVGINWYLNRHKLMLLLHYTWHTGNAGEAGDGARVNHYFNQRSLGAIQRGDWLGLGLNLML